jgi:hypothetical protein
MKRRFTAVLVLIAVLLAAVCLAGCGSGASLNDTDMGEKTPTGDQSDWAIYWYCCGSDLESDGGAATADIEEMLSSTMGKNVKVVLETGGAASWDNDQIDADHINRFEYSADGFYKVGSKPQADMGDPSTLADFLSFCKTNYPAKHTMLLFWNHGGGSASGACFDENYEYDSLSLSELGQAIGSVYSGGQKLDVVGFDCCLMATLDNANVLKNYANYMIASEETEPGVGWEYTNWLTSLGKNTAMDGAELGKIICDAYKAGCDDYGLGSDITLSVTDLGKITPITTAVDAMGTDVLAKSSQNTKVIGQFARSARSAENFGGNTDKEGYSDMVDLGDLMRQAESLVGSATSDKINEAIDDAVIYKVSGDYHADSSGLSLYYSYDGDRDALAEYAPTGASTNYTRFVQYSVGEDVTQAVQATTGNTVGTVTAFGQTPVLSIDNDGYVTMKLDPATLDAVSGVTFDLTYMDYDNNQLVFLGEDNDIDANWDTGVFKDNFRGVWGSMDGQYAYMELSFEGENYNLYSVPIKLNGKETYMTVAYDFDKENYKILGVSDGIDENTGMAARNLTQLQKGDQIILLTDTMSMDEGSDAIVTKESSAITYKGDNQFKEIDLNDGEYAYYFRVKDTTGNKVDSDFAYITMDNGDIETSLE